MLPLITRSKGLSASYLMAHYSDFVQSISPANLIAHYPLDELSGTKVYNQINAAGNVLKNPGFEVFDSPNFLDFSRNEGSGGGAVVQETVDVHSGDSAVKITCGTNYWQTSLYAECDGVNGRQTLLTPGVTYTLNFWCHGDGTHVGIYYVKDNTHSTNIIGETSTGVPGLTYQQIKTSFTVPSGCTSVSITFESSGAGYVSYWDDIELIAPASDNPTYLPIIGAPTMGEAGIGDGLTSMRFDGTDDAIWAGLGSYNGSMLNVLREALVNSQAWTVMIWARFSDAACWTEADAGSSTTHELFGLQSMTAAGNSDPSNMFLSAKWGGEDNVLSDVTGAGVLGEQLYCSAGEGYGTAWFNHLITWSSANDRYRSYFNGIPNNHPSWEATGLGVFTPILTYVFSLGCKPVNINEYFKGWLAHFALWDCELPQSTIRRLAL